MTRIDAPDCTNFASTPAILSSAARIVAYQSADDYVTRRGATNRYSPITDQRKPIMMKNPLNIMIRPMPPYGEFAPS